MANVRIVSKEKHYFIGECASLIEKSSHRMQPLCKSYTSCGGCTLAHVDYEHENQIKKNTVCSAFRRNGLDFSLVEDTIHSPNRTAYRNKIGVHYSREKNKFGLYRSSSNDVVDFEGCSICPQSMSDIISYTNENISLLDKTGIDQIFIRTSKDSTYTVSLYSEGTPDISAYSSMIKARFPEISEVIFINTKRKKKGTSYITDKICGLEMRFSSEAFRQVNGEVFSLLLEKIHEFAENADFKYAADLYCGSGIIGLSLAQKYQTAKFWGIEINSDAINDAKHNAEINSINNIEFFCGDAASFRKKIPSDYMPELIVVDPPRSGLSKEMKNDLNLLFPERIIYVSCNPQTLARDLADIVRFGYRIERVCPVNMFPMTRHVETVAYLCREKDVHQMKLTPSPFAQIKSGNKTIELRLFDEKRQKIKEGDIITFTNTVSHEQLRRVVKKLHRFDGFEELYKSLPLLQCGYTSENLEYASPSDMDEYYSVDEQKKYGVVGIELVTQANFEIK
ncbi:MAG: methyltransferase domain-containing protein [Ruminococcaceae bacterium]|nr:methyltransferase domain-containing protein [Oscillospiraceae bacterium]